MLFASSCALGTMIVDQSRVSTTVWRQRIARTLALLAVLELDPVALVDRAVELEGDAAEDVAERALERDREDGADDGRGGEHAGRVQAVRESTPSVATM